MPTHADNPRSTPRLVYFVDDEETDREMFSRLLRNAGLPGTFRGFARGDELIDALIEVLRGAPAPLVCFLDVRMPGMNGFDVLRWIRCQHAFDGMPVVMLSSSEDPPDLTEAQHSGAQCYVAKFPTPDHLQAIIETAERVAAARTAEPFRLPCNLLLNGIPAGV